ncbi:glycoside hydrolase family 15 protein [Pyxidicoccus fallax]|uniref:Trehalase n=1 Tax=Pyxidicoccus fallax TaxID=394095 RepID=A0A848L5V5_9BACT|nr:glycoside hydrolase family 15 protein [Pyxidicoccus fallax]NMO13996.1 glycoside hydrolase family 15 protein [Pyxidicoccus fallax]NPC76672.1 glycoside hydrolase family 15 protein [Pyxidicoccus fallax]
MALPLEAYALIGDTQSAALVGRDGSIDWLCWPRFDSDACFAALLGNVDHGRWRVAPRIPVRDVRRRYQPDTLLLETELHTDTGTVRLFDFMPVRSNSPELIRIVEGVSGEVPMRMELSPRFGYGDRTPWLNLSPGGAITKAGPDALFLHADLPLREENATVVADFTLRQNERVPLVLSWYPSHLSPPARPDPIGALVETQRWWHHWVSHCTYTGPWRQQVVRSLITLKALTYSPTGGLVAAPTTSLPERLGGVRNWDYRFCWVRDATLTLLALVNAGYTQEAVAWRDWLLRAVAGEPDELQIMYGVAGERRLTEVELSWLPGYEASRPVRIGNAAVGQLQLDVFGEIFDCFYQARLRGVPPAQEGWDVAVHLIRCLEERWREPDEGIWEVRGGRQHFTHSKVMAWVALDRAVKAAALRGVAGEQVEHWKALRDEVHAEICARGYDARRNTFTQTFGGTALDASLLLIPLVGFLPPEDPRVRGTVEAVQRELCHDGLVRRYHTHETQDGLPPGEGVFLACSFWLADALLMLGLRNEARELFERLLGLSNDVGLLAEEYEPRAGRMVGNFPQAFSHLALVSTAQKLSCDGVGPGQQRPGCWRSH